MGTAHKGATHGKHLLLTAGQRASNLPTALLQAREMRVDALQAGGDLGVGTCIGTHFEVLLDGHLGEDTAPLRDVRQAARHELVGGGAHDILAHEFNGTGVGAQKAGDGLQRGGLAGAVRADERHDLTVGHPE